MNIIFILFIIYTIIIFFSLYGLYINNNFNKNNIKDKDLLNFIYYSITSDIEDISFDEIKDFNDFKEYSKIILLNKIIQDIELDCEYNYILKNNIYNIYNEISKILEDDDDINKRLKNKYDILCINKEKDNEEYYNENINEYQESISTVDISKDLMKFM